MTSRKKIARKDVFRLARQKLIADIADAIEKYEGYITEGKAPRWKTKKWPDDFAHVETARSDPGAVVEAVKRTIRDEEAEAREGDITTVEEISKILPPEPPKKRGARARKSSPVSEHIRDEKAPDRVTEHVRETVNGLSATEEKVLVLIAYSHGGMTPAQIAIKIALKKRTIQNLITSLKSMRFIIKDANHGKFRITEEGNAAIAGRHWKPEKGAILNELSDSERKILFAIASQRFGVTLSAISVMVPGITKRTKQNIITALKTRELIEKNDDRFVLTEYAREELKDKLEKPLTGKALRTKLIESLPESQAVVIEWLSYDGGRTATAEEIANSLEYAPRTVQNIFTALKAQELIVKHDGRFQLSSHLKD